MELNIDKATFEAKDMKIIISRSERILASIPFSALGKTDESGHAAEAITLAAEVQETGLLRGNIRATVFDETGRPVHRTPVLIYAPAGIYRDKNFNDYVGTRVPLRIGILALDKKESRKTSR